MYAFALTNTHNNMEVGRQVGIKAHQHVTGETESNLQLCDFKTFSLKATIATKKKTTKLCSRMVMVSSRIVVVFHQTLSYSNKDGFFFLFIWEWLIFHPSEFLHHPLSAVLSAVLISLWFWDTNLTLACFFSSLIWLFDHLSLNLFCLQLQSVIRTWK